MRALGFLGLPLVMSTSLAAVEIHDDTLSFTPMVYFQVRAETAWSENADGEPYNVTRAVDGYPDDAHVYLRRFYLGSIWKYDAWTAMVLLSADQWGRKASGNSVILDTAVLGLDVKTGPAAHFIQFGKVQSDYCSAARTLSMMLPVIRPTIAFNAPQTAGLSCRSSLDGLTLSTTIQPLIGDDTASTRERRGLFYGARLQWNGADGFSNERWMESFRGAPGSGLSIGLDVGYYDNEHNDIDPITAGTQAGMIDKLVLGAEALLHYEALSSLVQVCTVHRRFQADSGTTPPNTNGAIALVQAGWAFHVGEKSVLEPAVRYSHIDHIRGNDDEGVNYGPGPDNGLSGQQFDACLTLYLKGNHNKISLAIQWWQGEPNSDGNHPEATVIRLQNQFYF